MNHLSANPGPAYAHLCHNLIYPAFLALCIQSVVAAETRKDADAPSVDEQPPVIAFVQKPGWVLMKKTVTRSPDGEHHAYLLSDESSRWRMLIHDGQEVQRAFNISQPVFSPDSSRLAAFLHNIDDDWKLLVDGQAVPCLYPIGPPLFSPDSKRVAYWSRDGKRFFLVVDGQAQRMYDGVDRGSLTFAPETGRPGYLARSDEGWLIVSGDRAYPIEGEPQGTLVFDEATDRFVLREFSAEEATSAVAEVDTQ